MATLLEVSGGGPQRQPKYTPVFIDRAFTGYFTQRAALHDPADIVASKYYGGRPDALWAGSNIELTNRLTLQRRPGLTPFCNAPAVSGATYITPPLFSYSFQLSDGSIQVIVDTDDSGSLVVSSVANASAGTAVYTGVFPLGGSNAYVGLIFTVAGFTVNLVNNGSFLCTASTTTSLTLKNAGAIAESHAATAITTGAVYVDNQDGTKTLLFAKSAGAGQTHFVAVAGTLYMGDGVDTRKYTPGNANGLLWNWGIVAPTVAPVITVTESASSTVPWTASTMFSTMGLVFDANGYIWQLASVNAKGTNTTQYGTSGSGQPAWAVIGGTTTDNTVTWTNFGPVGLWQPNHPYSNATGGGTEAAPCAVYDPVSNAVFLVFNPGLAGGTSGPSKPLFKNNPGTFIKDPPDTGGSWTGVKWGCMGLPGPWQKSHTYSTLFTGHALPNGCLPGCIVEPVPLSNPLPSQEIFLQAVTVTGTSGSGGTQPFPTTPAPTGGQQVNPDGDLVWTACHGIGHWVANTNVFEWPGSASSFDVIKVTVSAIDYFQVCTQTGQTGAHQPGTSGLDPWQTVYGGQTNDGTATWTCVGPATAWAASIKWYLPISGFVPPSKTSPYGGATIDDSNNNNQYVIASGVSGAIAPTWGLPPAAGGTPTNTTTDGGATWLAVSAHTTNSLASAKGFIWAFSYKARALDDFYSVELNGALPIPPGLQSALPAPTGSLTEAISTASPTAMVTGANAGAIYTLTGPVSTDPQVDTIVIWRTPDGGGPLDMLELTEIPNIATSVINGIGYWSFQDFLPDNPTSNANGTLQFPGLNSRIPAPINDSNNPPNSAFLPMVYNFQRIWGSIGEFVGFSGGPDVKTGNPNEAFAPADSLPFLAPVTRLVKTPQGLITFLTDSIEVIAGGPLTSSFFSVTWAPGIGLLNYNALDVLAGEIYFFASDNQFRCVTPGLNVVNTGFPLGDQFANIPSRGDSDTTWNPANVYVASHQNGIDNCIFVSDGATGWYRQNPRQVPGYTQGPEAIWSPYATITGGCQMVQSVETTPGIKKLLVGSATGGNQILVRSLTTFTDNGTPYDAYFVMGSITLAHPGQLALLKFAEFDFSGASFQPTISYLLNEISGTFTPFTTAPVFDPPSLYGTTTAPTSYSPNRYYFLSNASLARCRHLQVKVDYGSTSNGDEVYTMTIFGRLMVET